MSQTFSHAVVNGNLIPFSEAKISLAHPVFLTSFGVYETVQIDNERPFHLEDHLERLRASADLLQIDLPATSTLLAWSQKLTKTVALPLYTLQILALGPASANDSGLVAFFPRKMRTYLPQYFTQGAKAITYEGERALPQCKSLNTLVNHLARMEAQKCGCVEAILTHQGELFEGARSNLFVVEKNSNRLLTPPANKTLSGITKDIVIQVMQDTAYPVYEENVYLDTPISEMFITSTSMHVLPITCLNGQTVGNDSVGPVTQAASRQFEDYYSGYMASTNNNNSWE